MTVTYYELHLAQPVDPYPVLTEVNRLNASDGHARP